MATLKPLDSEMGIPVLRTTGGYFDLIQPTLEPASISDILVYQHEVIHDEMFRTTKFGFVQLMFKALVEQATNITIKRNAIIVGSSLFGSSVKAHEAAATYLSVKSLPTSMQSNALASYIGLYEDFYTAMSSIVDPVFSSDRAQLVLGKVVSRLVLGGRIIIAAAKWDGSDSLLLEQPTPNKLLESIAKANPFSAVAIQEQYDRLVHSSGIGQALTNIDDPAVWQKLDLCLIDDVESTLYSACMHAALNEGSIKSLMYWKEDESHAASLVQKFKVLLPDFNPPMHYFYHSELSERLKSLGAPFSVPEYRAEANARFLCEYNIDKTSLNGLLRLPSLPERGEGPSVLIADRNGLPGSSMWSYFEFRADETITAWRVCETSVARLFKQRVHMSQVGMPISNNTFFVVVGVLETFKSSASEYTFVCDMHRFIGDQPASFARHNVCTYMSGDFLLWLSYILKSSNTKTALYYPGELQKFIQGPNCIKTWNDYQLHREKFINAARELGADTFTVQLEQRGEVFFRIFPIHSLSVVGLLLNALLEKGMITLATNRDSPSHKHWDLITSVAQCVWREL